ncbi:reverse transcriptase domain, reverse transcriptase zinc-binding domain protein [Tanacetum coccineum]
MPPTSHFPGSVTGGSLWDRVIKSIHGKSGGLGDVWALGGGSLRGGVWRDIVRIGEEIDGLGIEFTSSFFGMLGNGRDIRFWVDRWVDHWRLCDRFPRLYYLDRSREGSVLDKGSWILDDDGEFRVKELARLVEEKMLHTDSGGQETIWNKLVPKKVNIFVWRALKERLLVRVELDRRDIDLDKNLIWPTAVVWILSYVESVGLFGYVMSALPGTASGAVWLDGCLSMYQLFLVCLALSAIGTCCGSASEICIGCKLAPT